ncbi:MAG TPA: hypothetical protein VGN88_08640, partial [Phycisphaerae bacterium]
EGGVIDFYFWVGHGIPFNKNALLIGRALKDQSGSKALLGEAILRGNNSNNNADGDAWPIRAQSVQR